MIKCGAKTIELRLYDQKRRQIAPGDTIRFYNSENPAETLLACVVELCVFASFGELYKALPLLECGYTPENLTAASPKDMDAYYTPEMQRQYGVVGIRIALI